MSDSEILDGGNSNQIIKQGNTVLRKTGAWSPFVHTLLRFLADNGFQESPVLLEVIDNHERLTFLDGEVGNDPLKPYMQTDSVLIEAASLLRRFHDLTQNFVVPPNSQYLLPLPKDAAHEVICHNDFAPYNCVFRDGHLVGIIDFDTASPNTRLWDIAYAVYRFAPLSNTTHSQALGWQPIPDRLTRLRLFCDTYGLETRSDLIETVIRRLESLSQFMVDTASNLQHLSLYRDDINFIRANQAAWQAGIEFE